MQAEDVNGAPLAGFLACLPGGKSYAITERDLSPQARNEYQATAAAMADSDGQLKDWEWL